MRIRFFLFLLLGFKAQAQSVADTITPQLIESHLMLLASDSLRGRGNYTPELHQAAHYIAQQFHQAGLTTLPGLSSFFQPFSGKSLAKRKLQPDSLGRYAAKEVLLNVVGVLPGKSLPQEAVIFSAHYDHLGGVKTKRGDRIFNGANDNASGTAAVLALAHYFAQRRDNERTLIFCAFSGEEAGLLGSYAFAGLINPQAVKAVINMEMIGQTNAAGKNAFFVTGAQLSDLSSILINELKGRDIQVKKEPAEEKQLFQRSDNYPFALKGIPAHTIMCSDDDSGTYHHVDDEVQHLDIPNMTRIVQAIAIGCQSIISGAATPSRLKNSKNF